MVNKDDTSEPCAAVAQQHKPPCYTPVLLTKVQKREAEQALQNIVAKKVAGK